MMCREFIALPVKEGDAFLLRVPTGTYLVDGGKAKNGKIIKLLKEQGVHGLTAAILTHTDADHLNGIHDLMKYRFPVWEYWLPSTWLDIAYIVSRNKNINLDDWIKTEKPLLAHNERKSNDVNDKILDNFLNQTREWGTGRVGINADEGKIRDCLVSGGNLFSSMTLKFGRNTLENDKKNDLLNFGHCLVSAGKTKAFLRFFDYRNKSLDYIVTNHRIRCVNGQEVSKPLSVCTNLESLQYLTKVNRESRVFHYDDGICEILFCGDSNFSFFKKTSNSNMIYKLIKPGIVTAPHHGSKDNTDVYEIVTHASGRCDNLIWVRSDKLCAERPCEAYKGLKQQKFCTTCVQQGPNIIDINFDSNNNQWISRNTPCPKTC